MDTVSRKTSRIAGVGSYLPPRIITNEDLSKKLDTSDEWIRSRVGIHKRHIADEGVLTSHLAIEAAKRALKHAHKTPGDIDLVIVATTTPDYIFPATAPLVQSALGIKPCAAFDVQAVCSGFIYALNTAHQTLCLNNASCALVIGAETMSRLLDWSDRSTCVLFGDGAGAVVLEQCEAPSSSLTQSSCVLGTVLYADGEKAHALCTQGGASQAHFGTLTMNGREVFKAAVINMEQAIHAVLDQCSVKLSDVRWVIPHQANQRILDSLGERLNLSSSQVISTIADHANTSAATIPLALDVAVHDGRIQKGDLILMPAMGGGFTWGASLVRY